MHLKELKKKTSAELVEMAEELGVEGASTMRRQDLMFAIGIILAEPLANQCVLLWPGRWLPQDDKLTSPCARDNRCVRGDQGGELQAFFLLYLQCLIVFMAGYLQQLLHDCRQVRQSIKRLFLSRGGWSHQDPIRGNDQL